LPAPPPGLVIRAAASADIPNLTQLANDPGYRQGTLRLPYQSVEATGRWFAGLCPGDYVLVAELEQVVIGNAALHRQSGRHAHVGVLGMGVRDAVRGRGVDTALLTAILALADDWLALRRLELTVFTDNAQRSPFTSGTALSARGSWPPTRFAAVPTSTRCSWPGCSMRDHDRPAGWGPPSRNVGDGIATGSG
jgi:putative acetyltransferase